MFAFGRYSLYEWTVYIYCIIPLIQIINNRSIYKYRKYISSCQEIRGGNGE